MWNKSQGDEQRKRSSKNKALPGDKLQMFTKKAFCFTRLKMTTEDAGGEIADKK